MHIVFFSPLYAYFIPIVAAIPFALHLFSRKKKRVVFSSVRLLDEIINSAKRNLFLKRWQKILLLILRALMLALLVAFAADPWMTRAGYFARRASNSVVFLFDVSMSRSWKLPSGEVELERDKRVASNILDLLISRSPDTYYVDVVAYSNDEEARFSSPFYRALRNVRARDGYVFLEKLLPTEKPTSHLAGISAAVKRLSPDGNIKKNPPAFLSREKVGTIFWFTDLASHGFFERDSKSHSKQSAAKVRLPDNVDLVVIAPSADRLKARPNLSLAGFEIPVKTSAVGEDYFFDALIQSYEFEGPALLELFSVAEEEKRIFEMPVNIRKNQINRARCFLPPGVFGTWRSSTKSPTLRLEIKGDKLATDNSYRFRFKKTPYSLSAKKGLRVLVVDGNPAPGRLSNVFYVESALKVSNIVGAVETISFAEFIKNYDSLRRQFSDYDAIVFSDFWPSSPYISDTENISARAFMNDYMSSGGGKVVVFFAGERLLREQSAIIDINDVKIYPAPPGVKTELADNQRQTSERQPLKIDEKFFDEILGLPRPSEFDWNVLSQKMLTVSYDGAEYTPVVSLLKDETAFILARREISDGMFFFINTTADRSWSDFCAKPVFSVLIESMVSIKYRDNKSKGIGDIYGFAGEKGRWYDETLHKDTIYYSEGRPLPIVIAPERVGIYPVKYQRTRDENIRKPPATSEFFYFVNTSPEESDLGMFNGNLADFVEKGENSDIYFIRYRDDAQPMNVSENSVATSAAMIVAGRSLRRKIAAIVLFLIIVENVMVAAVSVNRGKNI